MPLNKEAYLRYKIINACIRNKYKPYPSMDDLIEACEERLGHAFNVSTIQKDIEAMKNDEELSFKAPIKYSRSKQGYYYTDPNYSIHMIPLSDGDIESLKTAMDMISGFGGSRVSDNFNYAVEKILTAYKEHFPEGNFKRKIIQTDAPTDHKGFEHFETFFRAAKDKIPVCFVHYSYKKRTFNSVILHTALLKEFQNYWYIVGYSEHHKELRTFGMDRIYDPIYLDKKFIDTPQETQEEYFKYIYGVYPLAEHKKQKIVFRVKPMLGDYLLAHPLHESQKVLRHHDFGYLDLTLELIPSQELINYFLSFSSQLKVLQPSWIQEEIRTIHEMAIKNEKEIDQKSAV